MHAVRNPFKRNSVLVELSYPETEYLRSFFRDMSSTELDVKFESSVVRQIRFARFYDEFLKLGKGLQFL